MHTPPQPAYITLKDHKTHFNNDPKCRLINPTKNEISKVSKQILSKVVDEIRSKLRLKLMKNTNSVINWFEELMLKQNLVFIQFDIVDYYGSISEELFIEALEWAKDVTSVSDDQIEVIMKSKMSLLSDAKDLWKKTKNGKFNIAMGSWDGAEATDLCGLFLLSKIRHLNADFVLYRDDGLAVTRLNPKQVEDLKKELHRIFKRYGLSITTDVNHKIVNFLDVTLNLNDGNVTPFMKENNTILYVNKQSNHAPATLKAIPQGVQSRLTRNSSNQEIFNAAVQPYQDALEASGYDAKLKFDPSVKEQQKEQDNPNKKKRKCRSRRVTWFNPPYSLNVKTSIGKVFFQILKDCFPPTHVLYKICNKNTIKMSYRTMPNMGRYVAKHNNRVLQEALFGERVAPYCNCQRSRKADCPTPGQCTSKNVVYNAEVTNLQTGNAEYYMGCTKRPIKRRVGEHLYAINNPDKSNSCTLTTHVRGLRADNIPHNIKWTIRDRGPPFNPIYWVCRLCTKEKYYIMFEPDKATLNQRSEFFGHCWHKAPQLLVKQK